MLFFWKKKARNPLKTIKVHHFKGTSVVIYAIFRDGWVLSFQIIKEYIDPTKMADSTTRPTMHFGLCGTRAWPQDSTLHSWPWLFEGWIPLSTSLLDKPLTSG